MPLSSRRRAAHRSPGFSERAGTCRMDTGRLASPMRGVSCRTFDGACKEVGQHTLIVDTSSMLQTRVFPHDISRAARRTVPDRDSRCSLDAASTCTDLGSCASGVELVMCQAAPSPAWCFHPAACRQHLLMIARASLGHLSPEIAPAVARIHLKPWCATRRAGRQAGVQAGRHAGRRQRICRPSMKIDVGAALSTVRRALSDLAMLSG
jgi:hypothetical protein